MKKVFLKENLEIQNDFEYQIIEICNAEKAHKVLGLSHDMGIMMPKSIIISYSDGKTYLRYMQMKPWVIGMMFPDIDISSMSKKVMSTMKKILNETVNK